MRTIKLEGLILPDMNWTAECRMNLKPDSRAPSTFIQRKEGNLYLKKDSRGPFIVLKENFGVPVVILQLIFTYFFRYKCDGKLKRKRNMHKIPYIYICIQIFYYYGKEICLFVKLILYLK